VGARSHAYKQQARLPPPTSPHTTPSHLTPNTGRLCRAAAATHLAAEHESPRLQGEDRELHQCEARFPVPHSRLTCGALVRACAVFLLEQGATIESLDSATALPPLENGGGDAKSSDTDAGIWAAAKAPVGGGDVAQPEKERQAESVGRRARPAALFRVTLSGCAAVCAKAAEYPVPEDARR
jgi:hypothetical protein